MDAKRFGEAGLVGVRGRLGERLARKIAPHTPFDERTLAAAVGAYLFFSRTRRMLEMLSRLRRGA